MSNPPIQAQWGIDRTASSLVTTTIGTLAALGRDNVQPIAYVACEKLGATLAISDDIAHKIATIVVPPTTPAPIAFLKAQVGFFTDSSASLLGQSRAGLHFIALATALTPTLPLFDAAHAVEIMLRNLTTDPVSTTLPSARNIKTLLVSLEPRCHRAGFANEVLGWKLLLQRLAMPLIELGERDDPDQPDILLDTRPSVEMVNKLVDAFRQVGRIGASTATGVTIRLCTAVPWVVAFTKWSLQLPPRVCFDDEDNEEVFSSTDSLVTLVIPRYARDINSSAGMSIAIHHAIGSPCELLAPSVPAGSWAGMVPVKAYGELLLLELGFEADFETRMLHEALCVAIPQCLELINMSTFVTGSVYMGDNRISKDIDRSLASRRFSPLPRARKIAAAYQTLFDLPHLPSFKSITPATRVRDCPLVMTHLEKLKGQCPCVNCTGTWGGPHDEIVVCRKDIFNQQLSQIIATIFSLSLFDAVFDKSDSLLLSVPLARLDMEKDVEQAIGRALQDGEGQMVDVGDLLKHARKLIGHSRLEEEDLPLPIMTSARGQVLFPTLFESQCIVQHGYMALTCIPGVLKYDDEVYREAETGPNAAPWHAMLRPDSLPPVLAPLNLFPDVETSWEVTKQDDERLGCTMKLQSKTKASYHGSLAPMDCLFGLMHGLVLGTCPHNAGAALDRPDNFTSYCGPSDHARATSQPGSHVDAVAVHGADDLRMASVGYACFRKDNFYVLRGDACLACCLKLCRLAGINRLIL